MIKSLLGWAVLLLACAIPCAVVLEIILLIMRRLRPTIRLQWPTRLLIVCLGTVGLWYFIPTIVYALLGKAAH